MFEIRNAICSDTYKNKGMFLYILFLYACVRTRNDTRVLVHDPMQKVLKLNCR